MTNIIPFANQLKIQLKTHGTYGKGWPVGAVVHYTAGRDGAENVLKAALTAGTTFLCIQRDGKLFQAHPVNQWGYHAGESGWLKAVKKLVGTVSDDLIGIEVICAGILDKQPDGSFKTWWGDKVPVSEVRETKGVDNQKPGYYHIYTGAQEKTLVETLLWLKEQAPAIFDFDYVLGHDEVSGPKGIGRWRKTDPGASLSTTMTGFRNLLKTEYAYRQSKKEKPLPLT